ncbi:hypothetical protein HPB49_002288 [Dermacentor silvarum]|uniref:Uncharacterized protein n=1 Tax=Dermacentor silvarum TaxID=543639 RepID=A0ACB8BZX3_DERSI|nr:hypothetical protein HPB49_002288 [Dermacentor silvarum]
MMALPLVDMKGVRGRLTGLSVDYAIPCTARLNRLCHVCKNTAAWNGFFINVGLELREGKCGALSLLGACEGMTIANMATDEEKTQAATLLHWLLTQHRCVVKAAINDDVFGDQEKVVCRALSGSVGKISALTLLQSSAKAAMSNALVKAVRSMKHLEELNLMIDAPEHFDNLGPLLGTSSSLKVLRALQVNIGLGGAKDFLEGLYRNKNSLRKCVKASYFEQVVRLRKCIISMIQLHIRVVGVGTFYFYDLNMTSDLKLLIARMQHLGVDLTLVPFKLLMNTTVEDEHVQAHGQMPSLYDCMFRSVSKMEYIVHVDIDEFIVPLPNFSIPAIVQEAERKMKRPLGSLVVPMRYHCLEYPTNMRYSSKELLPLQTRLFTYYSFEVYHGGYTKYIARSSLYLALE